MAETLDRAPRQVRPGGEGRRRRCATARRSGRRPLAAFPGGYFPAFPGALPRASSPHGAEHAQVRAALPGTWTSPARLREAPGKFKAVAAPPSRTPPHRQAREPERASTSSFEPPTPKCIRPGVLPAARSPAGSLRSLPRSFLLKGSLPQAPGFCKHLLSTY